jgi:hypothetical protein
MIDREKVIKGLEMCTADIPIENGIHRDDMCQKCPYHNKKYAYCFEKNKLMQDALALLKEQEAIKPYAQGDGSYACNNCGETVGWEEMNCGGISLVKYKYCPECGRVVKWDD